MALDMAKYRALFLEEATEHLAEISRALIALEKDPAAVESIDLVFRMAHSIKSMAASVGHDAIADVAHALEDRMESVRSSGRLEGEHGLAALFRGLEGLERMVAVVRAEDRSPDPEPELVAALAAVADHREGGPPKKKALS
jgi:two-component system chemotaxis sensor kinase CheA